MIKFWVLSTIFYMKFPLSLLIGYLILGPHTKQLIRALVNDFMKTILVLFVVLVLIVWAIWHFLVPLFGM